VSQSLNCAKVKQSWNRQIERMYILRKPAITPWILEWGRLWSSARLTWHQVHSRNKNCVDSSCCVSIVRVFSLQSAVEKVWWSLTTWPTFPLIKQSGLITALKIISSIRCRWKTRCDNRYVAFNLQWCKLKPYWKKTLRFKQSEKKDKLREIICLYLNLKLCLTDTNEKMY